MKLKIGNFKGPKGDQGPEGAKGSTGETGQRGSRWTSGTAITGTSTVATIFPNTGIADAQLHDYYINPDTGNVYECTVEGAADVAKWTHIGNIKGPKGATGPAGSISDINDQKPTYTEAAKLENISSGETVRAAFGKLRKAVAVLIAHYTQKAAASILGHVKLSNSAAITTAGEYALDAIEKNASVNGTLANQIGTINGSLADVNSKLENFDANSVGKCYFRKITTQVPSTAEETLIATLHTDWSCPAIIGALMRRPDGTGYNTIDASTLNFRVTSNLIYAEFTGNSWWHGTELILYLTVGALNG